MADEKGRSADPTTTRLIEKSEREQIGTVFTRADELRPGDQDRYYLDVTLSFDSAGHLNASTLQQGINLGEI